MNAGFLWSMIANGQVNGAHIVMDAVTGDVYVRTKVGKWGEWMRYLNATQMHQVVQDILADHTP